MAVAAVGETPSLTGESIEKSAVAHFSLSGPYPTGRAAAPSKEGRPAWVNTEGPAPLQLNSCANTKKYGPNEKTQ